MPKSKRKPSSSEEAITEIGAAILETGIATEKFFVGNSMMYRGDISITAVRNRESKTGVYFTFAIRINGKIYTGTNEFLGTAAHLAYLGMVDETNSTPQGQ